MTLLSKIKKGNPDASFAGQVHKEDRSCATRKIACGSSVDLSNKFFDQKRRLEVPSLLKHRENVLLDALPTNQRKAQNGFCMHCKTLDPPPLVMPAKKRSDEK